MRRGFVWSIGVFEVTLVIISAVHGGISYINSLLGGGPAYFLVLLAGLMVDQESTPMST